MTDAAAYMKLSDIAGPLKRCAAQRRGSRPGLQCGWRNDSCVISSATTSSDDCGVTDEACQQRTARGPRAARTPIRRQLSRIEGVINRCRLCRLDGGDWPSYHHATADNIQLVHVSPEISAPSCTFPQKYPPHSLSCVDKKQGKYNCTLSLNSAPARNRHECRSAVMTKKRRAGITFRVCGL